MSREISYPRLGFLYGDYSPEIRVPALIDVTPERGVRLEVPYANGDPEVEPYAAWFTDDGACPSELAFRDAALDVHLVGVRATGFTGWAGDTPGSGFLRADFAVEDEDRSHVSYAAVDHLRSQIALLHNFMGWDLSTFDHESMEGKPREVVLRTRHEEPISVGRVDGIEVTIQGIWSASRRPAEKAEILEQTFLATQTDQARPIEDHAIIHERMRDLIAFATWRPVDVLEAKVRRNDAPSRIGYKELPGWRRLDTASLQRPHPDPARADSFADTLSPARAESIGASGILAWLQADTSLRRATDPLLNLLYMGSTTVEVALLECGIALEALGFRLALGSGTSRRRAKELSFSQRLECVLTASPLPISELLADEPGWLEIATRAYSGVKHANRPLPDPQVGFLLCQTFVMLIRAQVLVELGVPTAEAGQYARHSQWWTLKESYQRFLRTVVAD